jgi:hypothetical protein
MSIFTYLLIRLFIYFYYLRYISVVPRPSLGNAMLNFTGENSRRFFISYVRKFIYNIFILSKICSVLDLWSFTSEVREGLERDFK